MVIYGWRSSHIKTEGNTRVTCPHCGKKGGIVNSVFGRYFHIFWIPAFSLGKTGASQCTHCNRVYERKEMDNDMKRAYKTMKSDSRVPIWHFSGVFIVALLVGFFMISDKVEAQEDQSYIENPLAGDVYEYSNGPERYSTLKVVEVNPDSVYFLYNNYDYSQKAGIEEIKADSCYNEDVYMMSRQELENMFNSGTIYDVNR